MAHVTALSAEQRLLRTQVAEEAMGLAARLPRIVLEARRVSAAAHGVHGRRRAGAGESFWQFRPFAPGEPASLVDWRRSARDDRLYVRQREWEAAQSLWLWIDRSPTMGFASSLAMTSKVERAAVLGLALAETLVEAGERAGLIGLRPPRASRRIIDDFAEALLHDRAPEAFPPAHDPLPPRDEAVLISDFLVPLTDLDAAVSGLAGRGARGHLVMIADPVEETFPFTGQVQLADVDGGFSLRIGDAQEWGRDYRVRLAAHRDGVADIARRRGWTLTLHRTDRPASEAMLRVLGLIAASRGGGMP